MLRTRGQREREGEREGERERERERLTHKSHAALLPRAHTPASHATYPFSAYTHTYIHVHICV